MKKFSLTYRVENVSFEEAERWDKEFFNSFVGSYTVQYFALDKTVEFTTEWNNMLQMVYLLDAITSSKNR